jgi:hypothetical protein
MNIDRYAALQKFQCCGAAKSKMHSDGKEWLTFRHGWLDRGENGRSKIKSERIAFKIVLLRQRSHAIVAWFGTTISELESRVARGKLRRQRPGIHASFACISKNELWINLSKIKQTEQAAGSAAVWTEADNREAEAGKCQGARDSWVAK